MRFWSKFYIGFILIVVASVTTIAQDIHFSQFFANPLTLNPASSGGFKEDWRVMAIHRGQWNKINAGFNTTSIGADMNFKGGVLNQDMIGVSLNLYSDDMAGILGHQVISLAGAYHRTLDGHKKHRISGGIQMAYSQKTYNSDDLIFGDQFGEYNYDPDLVTEENLNFDNIPNFNFNAGLVYSYRISGENHVNFGFATYQIGAPNESLIESDNELSSRYSLELSANFDVTPKLSLRPHLLYMNQSRAKDFNPGLEVQYGLFPDMKLMLGVWYRSQDAVIGLVGLGYKNIEARLSYDQNTSSLGDITGATNLDSGAKVNAWEASIIIKGVLNRAVAKEYTVPCGIF